MREMEMLTRKGVYPYEYIDSSERFNERELPPREMFYSSLTDENITESEYDHKRCTNGLEGVWNTLILLYSFKIIFSINHLT